MSLLWPVVQGQAFELRAATPSTTDVALGLVLLLVVLEATRRTTGLMLPVTAALFLVYAWGGPALDRVGLSLIAHRGYSLDRIVGTLYVTLEGVLGVPLDVAATYIVLFTIYGAVVERGGAGRFFLDWSMAATGSRGAGESRPHGDRRGLSARRAVGQRRGQHRDARRGGLAADAEGRLRRGTGRRGAGRGRHRRHPGAAGHGRHRLPDGRVPEGGLLRYRDDGHPAGGAVLRVAAGGGRGGRPALRRHDARAGRAVARRGHAFRVASLRVLRRDGGAHGARRHRIPGRVLGHRGRMRRELPATATRRWCRGGWPRL